MSRTIVMASPLTLPSEPHAEPIPPAWVLSGKPVSRTKLLARSHDWLANVVLWECSAGSFNWHYSRDEILFVISGEALIISTAGEERLLGPGDFAYFPAGTSCQWRVLQEVKKIAFVRETIWQPLGFCLKVWNKALRVSGLKGKSPL